MMEKVILLQTLSINNLDFSVLNLNCYFQSNSIQVTSTQTNFCFTIINFFKVIGCLECF